LLSARSLDSLVPDRVGPWSRSRLESVLIPKAEKGEGTVYDSVVTRYYLSPSAPPVMLLVAYGSAQAGDAQLHRPEACYPAAGFKLHDFPDVVLRTSTGSIAARSLTATAPGRIDQILYWTRIGREFPTTSFEQRMSVLRQTLHGWVPDGVLVRISVMDEDRDSALKVIAQFANQLLASGGPQLREILEGRS
jgi:EpsI family protein